MDVNMPVTIVIKAPNQQIDDQTVECALGWTVKKLKQHLSSVYPSQPKEDQQRIIYSGRLLHDHLTLKDILRRDNLGNPHTIHLVCSGTGCTQSNSTTTINSSQSTPDVGSLSSEQSFTPQSSPDGLRNRMSHIQTQPNLMAYQHPYGHLHYQQVANGHHYSQQQMAMMQQMYAQQMAQYMQYLQHGAIPTTPTPPMTPPATPPIPQAAPAPQQAPQPGQQNAPNQNMRMNAQGGPVMDDDEEEGVRDWLDWMYIMSRGAVLAAILYFYSTFHRFLMVFGFFVAIWVYNAGIFRARRRQQRNEADQAHEQANQQQQQQQQQQNQDQADGVPEESTDTNTEQTEHPELPPRPGVLKILFTFFRTFFTSLVPENPQLVN